MVLRILINIGSGNGLLPDSTKPLPEPLMTYCQCDPHSHCNWNQNTKILFKENTFENVVCKTSSILFSPRYVNESWFSIFLFFRSHWRSSRQLHAAPPFRVETFCCNIFDCHWYRSLCNGWIYHLYKTFGRPAQTVLLKKWSIFTNTILYKKKWLKSQIFLQQYLPTSFSIDNLGLHKNCFLWFHLEIKGV